MNGPILISLDGSKFSEAALPWALQASRRLGVGLDVISVAEPIPSLEYAEWNVEAERWTAEYVDRIIEDCAGDAGGEVTGVGLTGSPLDQILKRAEAKEASLIVAATHGRGPLARSWLGSVADGLLRTAAIPVLLIRPTESGDHIAAPEPVVSDILVSLDGSAGSEAAVAEARRWTRAFDARLHLAQVVTYPGEIASPYLPQTVALNREVVEDSSRRASEHLEGIAAKLRGEGIDVVTHVPEDVHGAAGIAQVSREIGADLLVMATHGRGGLRRALLGSVTDKVVRSVDVPVVVTRIQHESP